MVVAAEYPVQLGIAYLFMVGYLVRTLFVAVRLPAAVGVFVSGFFFSFFFEAELLVARDLLQALAFFLVLLTAGLEITLQDLKPYMFVMAFVPASVEMVAIASYAKVVMDWEWVEGLIMGVVLTPLGDGLVIPKMKEFWVKFKAHPLPRLVFCWAPLEASFGLTVFGILTGLAAPLNAPRVGITTVIASNVMRIVATLTCGAVIGSTAAYLIGRRESFVVHGRHVFSGSSVEAFLMVICTALIAQGLGEDAERGHPVFPMPFGVGSMFQPELLVIVTGTFFSAAAAPEMRHEVEGILGGVWVFGQLVLFSMLGSKTDTSILPKVFEVVPIMAIGVGMRFLSIAVCMLLTVKGRGCGCPSCVKSRRETLKYDVIFCWLSTLPRATIQGALGAVALQRHFFAGSANMNHAEEFIFTAARLYIICCSVFGMITLNTIGPVLLLATSEARYPCEHSEGPVTVVDDHVDLYAADVTIPMMDREVALGCLAQIYDLDQRLLTAMLEKTSALRKRGTLWKPQEEEVDHMREHTLRRHQSSLGRLSPCLKRDARPVDMELYQFESRGWLGSSPSSAVVSNQGSSWMLAPFNIFGGGAPAPAGDNPVTPRISVRLGSLSSPWRTSAPSVTQVVQKQAQRMRPLLQGSMQSSASTVGGDSQSSADENLGNGSSVGRRVSSLLSRLTPRGPGTLRCLEHPDPPGAEARGVGRPRAASASSQ